MASRRGSVRIGTSGYQYEDWRGRLYPRDLPRKQWLPFYAQHFDSVEINSTFYRLPELRVFDAWREATPAGFCFALKFSRYGSHLKHLRDPGPTLEAFLERAHQLREKLGPILIQLPPRWAPDLERLEGFLALAPRELRWAIEFRDPRWLCTPVYEILRAHGAALCIHDLIARHPRELTSDWVYLRFHGDGYSGSYSRQFLVAQAKRIADYRARGIDVYAYFNNDARGYAAANASDLSRYIGPD